MHSITRGNILSVIQQMKHKRIILNDKEIVDKTGFSKSFVSNILSQRQEASQNFVDKFLSVFKLDTEGLSTKNEQQIVSTPEKYKVTIHEPKKSNMVNENNVLGIMEQLLASKKIKNQATIAMETGFDKSTISNIRSGTARVSYKFAKKFEESFKKEINSLSVLNEPDEDIQYSKPDKKGDIEMQIELKYLRQRIADLEKIISLYEKQTPEQIATAPGSKTKAG